jgi:Carboxypeptidase regulatory-like domain
VFRSCSPTVRRVVVAGSALVGALWLFTLPARPGDQAARSTQAAAPEPARRGVPERSPAPRLRAPEALPSLAGVVLDGARRAVRGALVCAASSRLMASETHATCTESDHEGRFALRDLPAGRTLLSATSQGLGASGQRDEDAHVLGPGQHVEGITLRLATPTVELRGVVRDAAGGVLSGALVQGTSTAAPLVAAETRSDDEGVFRLWLPAGKAALRASADGYARAERLVIAPRAGAELVLEPAGSVRGRVVWASDGRPASAVYVSATGVGGERIRAAAPSGPSGEFRLTGLRAGAYRLDAKGAHASSTGGQAIELALADELDGVVIEVERGAELRGHVRTGDGRPCIPGRVALLGAPDPTLDPPRSASATELAPTNVVPQESTIDPDGAVHFGGVPSGRYHVTVQCLGHLLASGPRTVDVDARDREGLAWTVARAATLTVEVQDAAGQPVPGAGVALHLPARGAGGPSGRMPLVSDHEGRVTVPNLAPGRYALLALSEPEHEPVPVLITPFGLAPRARLALAGAGALRITVRDAEGAPAEDLRVSLWCEGGGSARAPLTARPLGAGVYLAQALPAGRCRVELDDGANDPWAEGPLDVTARSEHTLAVTLPATGSLRGRVVDAAGAGLADVWVRAAPEGAANGRGRRVLSDVDGQFELTGLAVSPAGHRVIAQRAFGAEAVAEQVRTGARVTLTLPVPATLRGVVVDAHDTPLPGARVWATSGPSGRKAVASAGPDGSFVLRGLTPGPAHVMASFGAWLADELTLELATEQAPLRIRVAAGDVLARAPPP